MKQIEDSVRRTATGVAAAFGATAEVELPDIFAPLVNDPSETQFIADTAAELVGSPTSAAVTMRLAMLPPRLPASDRTLIACPALNGVVRKGRDVTLRSASRTSSTVAERSPIGSFSEQASRP
jgi:hypothetical protein